VKFDHFAVLKIQDELITGCMLTSQQCELEHLKDFTVYKPSLELILQCVSQLSTCRTSRPS